jgi:hypothetical protein
MQLNPKLAYGVVLVPHGPLLHSLGGAFYPGSQSRHYNVGQQALFSERV